MYSLTGLGITSGVMSLPIGATINVPIPPRATLSKVAAAVMKSSTALSL